jgi:hypothetical protein
VKASDEPLTIGRHDAQAVLETLQGMSWIHGWDESYKMGYVEWFCPSCRCHGQKAGEHHADGGECKLEASILILLDIMAMRNIYNPGGLGPRGGP